MTGSNVRKKTGSLALDKTPGVHAHGITHRAPPLIWQDGFPIGNGFLGAMVWGDGAPLKLTLDCADLWDSRTDDSFWKRPKYTYANLCRLINEKRYDETEAFFGNGNDKVNTVTPTKISIGRVELQIGTPDDWTSRLDLDCANVQGSMEAPFTMEANNAVTAGICDMLVQGWGDKLRIFPAVPDIWPDVVFRDLRAEGAWKVSAARRSGRTVWVRVTATLARKLRLRDPFAGAEAKIKGAATRRDGDCYVAALAKGQTLELKLDGVPFDWDQAVQAVRNASPSLLRLPE